MYETVIGMSVVIFTKKNSKLIFDTSDQCGAALLQSVRKHPDCGKKDKGREGNRGCKNGGGRDPHLAIWKLG